MDELDPSGPQVPTAWEILTRWQRDAPAELETLLKAAEPVLVREHEFRMEQARVEVAEAKAARAQRLAEARLAEARDNAMRTHRLYAWGLGLGFALACTMLVGAVLMAQAGYPWLAVILVGPSLSALVAVFVLRRIDAGATRQTARALRALSAQMAPSTPPAGP